MIERTEVGGEPVRLIALPLRRNRPGKMARTRERQAFAAWDKFVASDDIFGLDVEATAAEGLGVYDRKIAMRLIQFGTAREGWALDPHDPRWRDRIVALLSDESKRFVSHNAAYDTVRVWFEFGLWLGDRSIDTLPMAALLWPGKTIPGGKGLKNLSDRFIDGGLSAADEALHAYFVDRYFAFKPRKTALLPKTFEPGVSPCRRPKSKGREKCTNPSSLASLCGYCDECYAARKGNKDSEEWGWANVPLGEPLFLRYGCLDAIYVRRLLDILAGLVKDARMNRLSRTEQRVKRQMTAVSLKGHRVDAEWTSAILDETEAEFAEAEEQIEMLTGLKPRSPYMKGWFEDRGAKVKSLDKDHLPGLIERYGEHEEMGPALASLTTVSRLSNLLANLRVIYRHATEGDGFVHPNINTLQAHTGRMSVTAPAMQTLAKKGEKGEKLRGCFIAREGHVFVGADYDSQEIRIAAALSRDEALLRIVLEGLNQHVLTAENIFPDWVDKATNPDHYAKAKVLDFAQQYGAMPKKIAATLGISEREAVVLWQKWRHTYAGLVSWSDRQAKKREVRNPYGRIIPRDPYRDYANANYLIQSTGRDVLGEALCRLEDAGWAPYFWLPIHDELVMEVPEDRAGDACTALTECMTTEVLGIVVPAEGEVVGTRWRGLG